MALVNMRDMLYHAHYNGYAVGAFDVVSLEFLEGIMDAAERCHSPVILSLAEPHFSYFDFELIMPAVEVAARRASVPVAIHLEHGASFDSAVQAINLGCNGLMIDFSHLPLAENIKKTRSVVKMAHSCGVPVEGDLRYVPGYEDEQAGYHFGETTYTSLAEIKNYVEKTGVDFLAVSVGTVHGRSKDKPALDYSRLKKIQETLDIPLVINGNAELSDDQFQHLIANGVAKINYSTALADMAGLPIRDKIKVGRPGKNEKLTGGIRNTISVEVERYIHRCGSCERATELLVQCTPWALVDHLIIYNVSDVSEQDADAMMAEGRRVLSAIPGVREVVTGRALKEDAKYRYTWLVRFCHPAVVDSYRIQPSHVTFADRYFRPIAADRVSIDYKRVDTY